MWNQSQLARLPDVGETSGLAVLPNAGRVPDHRNAFILYRQATQQFRELKDAEAKSFEKADLKWSRADATLRGWLSEIDLAVSLMCGGASRPDAYVATIERAPDPPAAPASPESVDVIKRLACIGDALPKDLIVVKVQFLAEDFAEEIGFGFFRHNFLLVFCHVVLPAEGEQSGQVLCQRLQAMDPASFVYTTDQRPIPARPNFILWRRAPRSTSWLSGACRN